MGGMEIVACTSNAEDICHSGTIKYMDDASGAADQCQRRMGLTPNSFLEKWNLVNFLFPNTLYIFIKLQSDVPGSSPAIILDNKVEHELDDNRIYN